VVIDFRGDLRHLVLGRLAGRRLYGYGIRGGGFLMSAEIEPDEQVHESERYVQLARLVAGDVPAGPLRIALNQEDRNEAAALLDGLGLDPERLVVALCPVSRNPTRWWMPGRFAAVSRHLRRRFGAQILVFGAASSADFVESMFGEPMEGVYDLVGRTSLRGFAAVLEQVDLIISVESSPIHFASALGKPIVTLFGGTSLPQHWAPHGVPHRIVHREVECAPCFRLHCPLESVLCLEAIEVKDVIEASEDLLAELAASRPELGRKLGGVLDDRL
jgi:ADP-heptose:LPS heptosyltransferase